MSAPRTRPRWLTFCLGLAVACSSEATTPRPVADPGAPGDPSPGDPIPGDLVPTDEPVGDSGGDAATDEQLAFGLLELAPDDGAVDVPVDQPVTLTFTKPVLLGSVRMQAAWGPCESLATLLVSFDGFTTCAGGVVSRDTEDARVVRFVPKGGLLTPGRTYRVKLRTEIEAESGEALPAEVVQASGFAVVPPPCAATKDPATATTTGAVCVPPTYVDNGDGTVTDVANKLLWSRCSVDAAGVAQNGTDFACVVPNLPADMVYWETALAACEALTLGGRSDWTLPDIAQLATLLVTGQDPALDQTAFPNSSNAYYESRSSSLDQPATRYSFLFGYAGFTGVGRGGKNPVSRSGFIRCVAAHQPPVAPVLNPLELQAISAGEIRLYQPSFRVAPNPLPPKAVYIGVDGVMQVNGASVTGAVQGPLDVAA